MKLVVGLGNSLLMDDGIGVHAVRCLQKDPPPDTVVAEVGTDLFSALSLLESADRVLAIDAMDAQGVPGTIYQCKMPELAHPNSVTSLHELGLCSVLEFLDEKSRPLISILGIQPAQITYGLELSPCLQKALPQVVQTAREILASWQATGRLNTSNGAGCASGHRETST